MAIVICDFKKLEVKIIGVEVLNGSSTLTMDNMARLGIESEDMSQMPLINERSYQDLKNKHKEEGENGGMSI